MSGTKPKNRILTLNVGGRLFKTNLDVLTRYRYSFFGELFSGKYDVPCMADDVLFIDRSARAFEFILDFLRTGDSLLCKDSPAMPMVAIEAKYFNLKPLLMQLDFEPRYHHGCIEHEGPYGL